MPDEKKPTSTRRCARCGDWIERLVGAPLCGGCRLWAWRMVEQVEVKSDTKPTGR